MEDDEDGATVAFVDLVATMSVGEAVLILFIPSSSPSLSSSDEQEDTES